MQAIDIKKFKGKRQKYLVQIVDFDFDQNWAENLLEGFTLHDLLKKTKKLNCNFLKTKKLNWKLYVKVKTKKRGKNMSFLLSD